MEKKMRVLVVEDHPLHQESARQLLGADYDVEIISNPDKFMEKMFDTTYDTVLLDLLMPATNRMLGRSGQEFIGQPMTYGMFFLWIAVQQDVPFVGILTDSNHHDHPASAALDDIIGPKDNVMLFKNSKVVIARELFSTITINGEKHRAKDWLKLLQVLTGESQVCDPKYGGQVSETICL